MDEKRFVHPSFTVSCPSYLVGQILPSHEIRAALQESIAEGMEEFLEEFPELPRMFLCFAQGLFQEILHNLSSDVRREEMKVGRAKN